MTISLRIDDDELDKASAALDRAGVSFGAARPERRSVLDTFDGRLHAAGMRLELREASARELVLVSRDGSPPAAMAWDGAPPTGVADLPPGPFGSRVAAAIGERALVPAIEIHSTRRSATRHDRRGRPVLAVTVHDDVRLRVPRETSVAARIVEVTPSAGHDLDGDRWYAAVRRHGVCVDGDVVDAVVDATGTSLAGFSSDPMVELRRDDDAIYAFRVVLRNLLDAVEANIPGTLAEIDPEFLHDLRVAIRRTRSVLAEGKGVLPDDVRTRYRKDFGELARATGRARDLDVYIHDWHDTIAPLGLDDPGVLDPVLAELEEHRRAAHVDVTAALTSPRTEALLTSWRAWLDGEHDTGAGDETIGPHVANRIRKAQRGLLRDGRAITPESPGEQLHELRKDAKKLRYLFECFGSVLPAKGRKRFVSQLKLLQDNLGRHQDAEVQVAELRALAQDLHARGTLGADALLAVGRVVDHLERVRQHERERFAACFDDYDRARNRSLLAEMLDKAARA